MAEPVRFVRIETCKRCGKVLDGEQVGGVCVDCLTYKGSLLDWYSLPEELRNQYLYFKKKEDKE